MTRMPSNCKQEYAFEKSCVWVEVMMQVVTEFAGEFGKGLLTSVASVGLN